MDHRVRAEITDGLRKRGVDVLTAEGDGARRLVDPDVLNRGTALGRILMSQDSDLLVEAARRQGENERFGGVIYSRQLAITIGQAVQDLELMATAYEPEDVAHRVEFIPL